MTGRIRIAIAAACAVMAMAACASYADGVRADADRQRDEALERYGGEVASLVVATGPLEAGDVISRSNVQEREWLVDLAPAEALTSLDDVIGKTVTEPVAQGAPLSAVNFRDVGTSVSVPAGHVALTIPLTDKLGISREVAVGSAAMAWSADGDAARLIADDVSVLAVPANAKGGTTGSLTLAVLPADVQAILVASASGDLRIVLPADDVEASMAPSPEAPTNVPSMEGEAV